MSAEVTPFSLVDAPLDQGTVLLEASAGTGKTYTITGLLVRMLLEDVVEHVEEALVVTFTVAAADELKNRLRAGIVRALKVCQGDAEAADGDAFFAGLARHGRVGAEKLRRALDEFDQASVMTIHGFCKRLLEESAFESDQPFELEFTTDEAPLLQTAAADALRAVRCYDTPLFGAVLQRAKVTPDRVVKLYREWRRHPGTRLEPARPQIAPHLAELLEALQEAADRWDPELLGRIAGWKWNKKPGQVDATAHALERALAESARVRRRRGARAQEARARREARAAAVAAEDRQAEGGSHRGRGRPRVAGHACAIQDTVKRSAESQRTPMRCEWISESRSVTRSKSFGTARYVPVWSRTSGLW